MLCNFPKLWLVQLIQRLTLSAFKLHLLFIQTLADYRESPPGCSTVKLESGEKILWLNVILMTPIHHGSCQAHSQHPRTEAFH